MADYQRIVEFLRDIRQGMLQNVDEEITQAATEYKQLCEAANERLRKCSTYLQQGLRTEAIHLADEPPNLLDLVAALDLPDPQIWTEFCMNNGLAVAPPLQLDRAAQLNEAYAADQPLEHLMAQHRLLALSRAPVGQRLEIMRKISSMEPGNANWEKDLRVFETARIKELPSVFLNAVRNKDDRAIGGLMSEITQNSWFEPVPSDLVSGVSDAFNRMQRASVEVELLEMVPSLRDAYAARSFKECQAMALIWKNKMAVAGVTMISQELTDEIRPVIAFVAEQEKREEFLKKFRNSCKAFEAMLDRDASDPDLEMGYAKLKQFNEPIPDELTQRYHQKDALRQKTVERSHRLRLIGIGSTVLAILIIGLITVYILMRGASAGEWARKIQSANLNHSSEGLTQANAYIDDLRKNHASMLSEGAVAAAVRDTESLQANMERDRSIISNLIQKLIAVETTAGPVASNDAATPEETLTAAAQAQEVMDQAHAAGDLAWADTDKKLSAEIIRVQNIFTTLSARASTSVRTELDKLTAKLDGINGGSASATADLSAVTNRLAELHDLKGLDEDTKTMIAALGTKLDTKKQGLVAEKDMAGDVESIRQAVGSAEDWRKALYAFAQKYPSDPRTADFNDALTRAAWIKELDAWRNVTDKWGNTLAPPTSASAQQRMDAITAYLAGSPDSPIAATAVQYATFLKHATDAMAASGTWQTSFNDFLSNPVISQLSYMETSDHHRYYTIGDIKRVDRRLGTEDSVSFEVIDPSNTTKRVDVTIDPPLTLLTQKPEPTPQAKLAQELSDQIKVIDENNWDMFGIDMIERVAHDDKVNLAVRAVIVQQLIKTEQDITGWALGDVYAKTTVELARQNLDMTAWVDEEYLSSGSRASLKKTLANIPSAASVKEQVAAAKKSLFQRAAFAVTAGAVLLKDDSNAFVATPHGDLVNGGLAFIVMPPVPGAAPLPAIPTAAPAPAPTPTTDAATTAPAATEGDAAATPPPPPAVNPAILLQVGTILQGKLVLDQNALRGVPVGSLIYITRP